MQLSVPRHSLLVTPSLQLYYYNYEEDSRCENAWFLWWEGNWPSLQHASNCDWSCIAGNLILCVSQLKLYVSHWIRRGQKYSRVPDGWYYLLYSCAKVRCWWGSCACVRKGFGKEEQLDQKNRGGRLRCMYSYKLTITLGIKTQTD